MKLLDAIKEMKKGEKIRRTTWNEGHYWRMKDTEIVNNKDEVVEDWEVYNDRRVKCIYCKQPKNQRFIMRNCWCNCGKYEENCQCEEPDYDYC